MAEQASLNSLYLEGLNIKNAKGLVDVTIGLNMQGVTCITGPNGIGKSTILHLFANAFDQCPEWMKIKPFLHNYSPNKAYNFSDFFHSTKKNNLSGTEGEYTFKAYDPPEFFQRTGADDLDKMHGQYQFYGTTKFSFQRRKSGQGFRWFTYGKRPLKTFLYIGLNFLATEAEIDNVRSPYMLGDNKPPEGFTNDMKNNVLVWARHILGKEYNDLFFYKKNRGKVKNFISIEDGNVVNGYTSHAMGAGERKIFYLLIWLSMLPPNSLVLIDEPEALLYNETIEKLFKFFVKLSKQKNLQIVCTTHWAGIRDFKEKIKLFILARNKNKKVTLHENMEAVTFQSMHGEFTDKKFLLVEDKVAELIVQQVVREENKGSFYHFVKVGGIENIPNYARILIEIGEHEFWAISDGDVDIESWESEAKKSQNMLVDDLKKKHISLLPKKIVKEDEAKLPEYIILSYGQDGLDKSAKSYIANCSLNSKKEIKERICEIADIYGGNEIIPINDMVRSFADNYPEKWSAYTKDVRAKIRSDRF